MSACVTEWMGTACVVFAAGLLSHGACATSPLSAVSLVQPNDEAPGENIDRDLMPPLQIHPPRAAQKPEPRFDLAAVNTPAAKVFLALVNGTGYSMLLPPRISGKISVKLKDVTLLEALESLRELYGYDFKIEGARIFIQPNALQSRVFQVNYLSARRQGSSDMRATDIGRVSMSSDSNFWRDLAAALQGVVGSADGRKVIVSEMSGVVVVRGFPADMRNVEAYLKAIRVVVQRQLMFEAKIIEVKLNDNAQSGIDWSLFGAPTAQLKGRKPFQAGVASPAAASGPGFVGLAFPTNSFAALLAFLETQGDVAVLSSPRIATLNNQKAMLKVGTDELFISNISGGTTATAAAPGTAPSLTLQAHFSGISLDFTPQIDGEGNIILHFHPALSSVSDAHRIIDLGAHGIFKLPLAASAVNETDSIVRVRDGNIVAIGGLMRLQRGGSQAPGGGAAPGVPPGQRNADSNTSEMVILMKPTIIDNDKLARADPPGIPGRIHELDPRRAWSADPGQPGR